MDNDIQLISDGDGLGVIGNATDVERFLVSEGLSSKDLGLQRLKSIVGTGAVVAQAGSDIAANSGRWVKLTRESAQLVKKLATIDGKVDDVLRAQKDAVLARMIGVGFVIEEAMTIREKKGRVDEVTWSKVQTAPMTIAETQA